MSLGFAWGLLFAVVAGGVVALRGCRAILRTPSATQLKWEAVGSIVIPRRF